MPRETFAQTVENEIQVYVLRIITPFNVTVESQLVHEKKKKKEEGKEVKVSL
jgi:hypothetical protein